MTFTNETSLVEALLRDAATSAELLCNQRGVEVANALITLTVYDRELLGALGSSPGAECTVYVSAKAAGSGCESQDQVRLRNGRATVVAGSPVRPSTPQETRLWEDRGCKPLTIPVRDGGGW